MNVRGVIVNYRTPTLAVEAIGSVVRELDGVTGSVMVVDNASGDGSVEILRDAVRKHGWADHVEVIASSDNGGFGAGNNVAITRALAQAPVPDILLFVNPDARLCAGALAAMLDVLREHPEVAIVGPRIEGPDGARHESAFRFPTPLGELDAGLRLGVVTRLLRRWVVVNVSPIATGPVDWVSGACFAARRSLFECIGVFDEDFFLYYEETELCHRAARAGYQTWYVHEARARHIGGASTGARPDRRLSAHWFDSRRQYFLKTQGRVGLWTANALFIGGYALWRARNRVQRKPSPDPPHFFSDFLRHSLEASRSELETTR